MGKNLDDVHGTGSNRSYPTGGPFTKAREHALNNGITKANPK